ncbi:HNH endonuclease signature motif containing protein [Vineibacter terrae]|uniref:HNH endonuclease n=1 Tax=Vineibacter terrae TaxID=2586908 RepID=UPI002E309DD1|nr:HNH endonuclease signature motif containing protein [Vineibacter terrae]HEX2889749.1 HNH endonuclease signature motif containing protein [Vineibacter terrae]
MAYWWLNQKEDDVILLEEEGIVAVPRRDKLGKTSPSYATAGDMRPADIGFVFVGGDLEGVFTVVKPPQDEAIEMAPDFQRRAARIVEVSFFGLPQSVTVEETTLRLRDVLPVMGSPLDPNGAEKDTSVHPVGEALAERLVALCADADPMSEAIGEAMAEAISVGDLPEETKNDLIEARLGFGRLNESVLALWNGGCCATGTVHDVLVRTCAIKPWARATNEERLDSHNALPLLTTWHIAFITGLIAFADDGALLLSADLPAEEARKAGIDPGFRLAVKGERQVAYLAWHRANVFRAG